MAAIADTMNRPLRIGISQRHWESEPHAFARDALESAWHTWFSNHWNTALFMAIPNFGDAARTRYFIAAWSLNAFILSGGGDADGPAARAVTEAAMLAHARQWRMPVMGVCRGMQTLHQASGGKLVRVDNHVGSTHTVLAALNHAQVNSWHAFGIETLAPDWYALATAGDGSVEAMQHIELPWLGVMWHPERPHGNTPELWTWIRSNFESPQQTPVEP